MLEYRKGNLLESGAEALVNTVNCVGVMGKGIAFQFKNAFPDNFKAYKKACDNKLVKTGKMFVFSTDTTQNPRFIINFPTKNHWRGKSELAYIREGLGDLIFQLKENNIGSVAIPPLGCGFGGLDWSVVKKMIEDSAKELPDVNFIVFEPDKNISKTISIKKTKKPGLTKARALLIALMDNYAGAGYELSKLEIQKLAYFLQEAGEPLRLNFVKYHYGPYADNLRFVLENLDQYYISGYADGSSGAEDHGIKVFPEAVEEALLFLAEDPESITILKKVAEVIRGFETPYGVELLATVHWVLKEKPAVMEADGNIIDEIKGWSKRKKYLFSDEHIVKALEHLQNNNFIPGTSHINIGSIPK